MPLGLGCHSASARARASQLAEQLCARVAIGERADTRVLALVREAAAKPRHAGAVELRGMARDHALECLELDLGVAR